MKSSLYSRPRLDKASENNLHVGTDYGSLTASRSACIMGHFFLQTWR